MIRRKRKASRVGKLGIVRLDAIEMKALRAACWDRDKGICQETGERLYWEPRFPGDPLAYDMAHIRSRGAGGNDTLDNVRALCHSCHMKEHSKGRSAFVCAGGCE